jgi:hypothetical protein
VADAEPVVTALRMALGVAMLTATLIAVTAP